MQETLRDPGKIPGLGRSPGNGNGNPLQYSCLEHPMDWRATVHGVTESDTAEAAKHAKALLIRWRSQRK